MNSIQFHMGSAMSNSNGKCSTINCYKKVTPIEQTQINKQEKNLNSLFNACHPPMLSSLLLLISLSLASKFNQLLLQNIMSHPVHDASESSPYGDLTREEFYKNHQILHKESFMLNQQNMKIFTQSWRPNSTLQLEGLVAMEHGYNSESSWLFELTAVAIAKAGFLVCAIDLQGHGYSDSLPGHIPNIEPIVCDCIQFFDSIKVDHPKLPAFIYGESLGGAIAILVCLKQKREWNGLILNGSMCGISAKFKPTWPLEKLLPVAAFLAPTWKIVI